MTTDYVTFPSETELVELKAYLPAWQKWARHPWAVVFPNALSDPEIEDLLKIVDRKKAYSHPGCDAKTREYAGPGISYERASLGPIVSLARQANRDWWNFALDSDHRAWLQSYDKDSDRYHRHIDRSPMCSRKLTAVAMLSDPADYDGGILRMQPDPAAYFRLDVPRERGTVVVFETWIVHEVTPVTRGLRQTVNLGIWGPPFR